MNYNLFSYHVDRAKAFWSDEKGKGLRAGRHLTSNVTFLFPFPRQRTQQFHISESHRLGLYRAKFYSDWTSAMIGP